MLKRGRSGAPAEGVGATPPQAELLGAPSLCLSSRNHDPPPSTTHHLPTRQTVLRRVVREAPSRRLVPSFGYVSLFPLLMGLLPPASPELGRQIALLTDEQLLWTPYGLRSLAKTSSIYKQ